MGLHTRSGVPPVIVSHGLVTPPNSGVANWMPTSILWEMGLLWCGSVQRGSSHEQSNTAA